MSQMDRWNYRVVHELADPKGSNPEEVFSSIREVFYQADRPVAYSSAAATVAGDNLAWVLERMLEALEKPALWGPSICETTDKPACGNSNFKDEYEE